MCIFRGRLSLSCCSSTSTVPAFSKGYSLLNPTATRSTLSIASVGIGYGLNNLEIPLILGNMKNLCSSKSYPAGIFSNLQTTSSILRPPLPNSLGRAELKSIWCIPPKISNPESSNSIDISCVEPKQFYKYAKNSTIGCIWYTTNSELDTCINSMTVEPYDPDLPPPKPPPVTADIIDSYQDVKNSVPQKYQKYFDVFSPTEVMQLPDHRLYNINIDLEEGKTPPFSPIYSLSQEILHSRHSVLTSHPGHSITYNLVKQDYSWPGMQTYIRQYVLSCEQCARIKNVIHKPYGLLQPLEIPEHPWQSIAMDFIVKLPPSHGYNAIWVVRMYV